MKIYLAISPRGPKVLKEVEAQGFKTNSILVSYFYFKNIDISNFDKETLILDSGAFTFMNKQKASHKQIDWDAYIEDYANYINKYDIKHFFELDIDVLVGLQEVERLRAKLERLTNKQSIPVFHKARGTEYFKEMCNKYKYVAIGGLVINEITKKDYPILVKMVNYANSKGVKVHGLGFTNMQWLKKIKWYSVDSTSWTGAMFSYRKYFFIRNTLKSVILKGLKKDKYKLLVEQNLIEWIKFQQYADKYLN